MKPILKHLVAGLFAVTAGSALADGITFYQGSSFGGRSFNAERAVPNFSVNGFNDKVHSAVVHDGQWEICIDADFRGGCGVLAPGAYPDLGDYAGRVSSARRVEERRSDYRPDNRMEERGHGREARAILYEGPNMSGRAYALNDIMRDMGRSGFNDRASSLRIERGYWIFCTDAEFRGECRTFGPGEYPTLPGMNNAISSGRRIANAYPYGERPDWQRDREGYRSPENYPGRQ